MTIRHTAYIGTTRYGKSEACFARVAPMCLERLRPAVVLFDPPGTLTSKFGQYLRSHGIPFLYDKLQETSGVLGYPFCLSSENRDSEQSEAENRETVADAISVILRSEGKLDATRNQMILRGLTDALLLLIYQKTPVPFHLLKDCFDGNSPNAQFLLNNLNDSPQAKEVYQRFVHYHSLRGQQRQFEIGPAERRLLEVCACVQFRKRCQPTFDIVSFLNSGGILLVDGSSKGNLSRPDAALLMGMQILLLIALARSGKLRRKLVLVIDEGINAGLIDLNVARAMNEAGKWGLEFHLIIQNPLSFPVPEIGEAIFQNCARVYFFRQVNPQAAMLAASMCSMSTYDPKKVKDVIIRIRMEHDGVDIKPIKHTSESVDEDGNKRTTVSEGHYSVPQFKRVADEQNVYLQPNEQTMEWAKKFRNLRVGECVIQDGEVILEPEGKLPLLTLRPRARLLISRSPKVTLGEHEFEDYLRYLKTTDFYKTPQPFNAPVRPVEERASAMVSLEGGSRRISVISRDDILLLAEENPLDIDIIQMLGDFPTIKAAQVWAQRQEAAGKLKCVGTMKNSQGKKVQKVYCNTWTPKEDNLRHEVMGTRFRILYADWQFERGHRIGKCYADLVMKGGPAIEIDCGTMRKPQVLSRWRKHKDCDHDLLIVVCPRTGDPDRRMQQLMDWSDDIRTIAFFATLRRLEERGGNALVWDYLGRDDNGLKAVTSVSQVHTNATPLLP